MSTDFERTKRDFIRHTVRDMIDNTRVGVVAQVYEHTNDDDDSNFEVDVAFPAEPNLEHRVAPLQKPGANAIDVPRVGDKVVVGYRHGDKKNPIVQGVVDTLEDRAVKGSAGMWRRKIESGNSPAGDGDLYITGDTTYDGSPALKDHRNLTPTESKVQIAKKADATDESDLPVSIELFDSPDSGEAHVRVELNKVNGSDSVSWGLEFNLKTGEMKILDGSGYGIESDGSGNFTWHYESIDYSQGTISGL